MSDSDDTDILLFIPPDYFNADVHSPNSSALDLRGLNSTEDLYGIVPLNQSVGSNGQITELRNINEKLKHLELYLQDNKSGIYSTSSSNQTKYSSVIKMPMNYKQSPSKLYHSTPKAEQNNSQFIGEIDQFLKERPIERRSENVAHECPSHQSEERTNYRTLANQTIQKHTDLLNAYKMDYYNPVNSSSYRMSTMSKELQKPCGDSARPQYDDHLLSLSNIWGPEGKTDKLTQQEERIRREHCEKTIQSLQTKLLEYQQKISVAIKVDKKKDEALAKQHETNSSLMTRINSLETSLANVNFQFKEDIKSIEFENAELKQKNVLFERELRQTIDVVKKLQERNELLEIQNENSTKTTNEIREIHRAQLEDLEIRLSNSKQSENLLNGELEALKMEYDELKNESEKNSKATNVQNEVAQSALNEIEILKQQKESVHEKLRGEKSRAETLDKHKTSLQGTVDSLIEREKSLLKELDSQRSTLKSYYQNQLECVVGKKLQEFQKQLDTVEETLQTEAKARERLIAERAIKQMELINQKNDQEYALLNEKHNQEIELYRIQLANSSRTINALQEKLNGYQTKRADIAEKLHNVMETQWQKALEIISSPTNVEHRSDCTRRTIDVTKLDKNKADGVAGLYHHKAENEVFETPTTSRDRRRNEESEDTSSSGNTGDKLQQYIELLLKNSPRDLEHLDDILNMPKKSQSKSGCNSTKREAGGGKQPWK